jgi:hypothetical protein
MTQRHRAATTPMRLGPRLGLRLRVGVGALALLGALSGAGCTAARNTLGTNSGPCFRAVAVATEAVKDRGTLAGVRLLGARDLEKHPRLRDALATRAGHAVKNVCAVAFTGQFHATDVRDPLGKGPSGGVGRIAVVLVSYPQDRLLGTIVLSKLPLPFRHEVLRRPLVVPPATA